MSEKLFNERNNRKEEIWTEDEYFVHGMTNAEEGESDERKAVRERHRRRRRLYLAPVLAVFVLLVITEFHYVKQQVTYQYTVVEGDTLWDISRRYYGQGFRYIEIVVENEEGIDDPDLIYPGEVYRITVTQWVRE